MTNNILTIINTCRLVKYKIIQKHKKILEKLMIFEEMSVEY